jgi:hypothetical protein
MVKTEKKAIVVQRKPKAWHVNDERNKARRAERHKKRMEKQASKILKVPHGTARKLKLKQRMDIRKHKQNQQEFWLKIKAQLIDKVEQQERERKAERSRQERETRNQIGANS